MRCPTRAREEVLSQRRLATKPAGGKIGASEWIDLFQSAAYSTFMWDDLATLFSRYEKNGRARPLIRQYRSDGNFGDDNSFAVYNAVQCTDAPWPEKWKTWDRDARRTARTAPLMTWPNTWFNAPCLYWPAPSGKRFDVRGTRAPKSLLIGGTLDGATPYQGSKKVRRLFPQSRLVAIKGEANHAVSTAGNQCVSRVLYDYLESGKLPGRRSGNVADVVCKPMGLPDPGYRALTTQTIPRLLPYRP